MSRRAEHDISRKLKILNYAKENGNVSKTCHYSALAFKLSEKIPPGSTHRHIFSFGYSHQRIKYEYPQNSTYSGLNK